MRRGRKTRAWSSRRGSIAELLLGVLVEQYDLTSPHFTWSHLTPPHPTWPHLTSPDSTWLHPTWPHLISPHVTSPHPTPPHLLTPPHPTHLTHKREDKCIYCCAWAQRMKGGGGEVSLIVWWNTWECYICIFIIEKLIYSRQYFCVHLYFFAAQEIYKSILVYYYILLYKNRQCLCVMSFVVLSFQKRKEVFCNLLTSVCRVL